LQDTWLAVVRNAAKFEPRAKFSTWLYTIARSKMIDHWRARDDAVSLAYFAGDAANDGDEVLLDVAASDACRPDHQAMARAEARAFLSAVEALPPPQREAFLLQVEGGLSLEEIAAVTGAAHETVKSRLRYAMNKLRAAMETWQ
jgi:RNA polymerase sigma factor (sigma-70 family)